jgi:hypothetical protein
VIVKWTEAEVAAMSVERARELSEQVKASTMTASDGPQDRADTFRLLRALDAKIAQAPDSVEDRAASARQFLYGGRDPQVSQRAFDVAVSLYGSEREAKRRGYNDPRAA